MLNPGISVHTATEKVGKPELTATDLLTRKLSLDSAHAKAANVHGQDAVRPREMKTIDHAP